MKPSHVVLLLALLCTCACHAAAGQGPVVTTTIGVISAALAAVNELFASGVLTHEQYLPLATALNGIGEVFTTTTSTIAEVKSQLEATKADSWTTADVCKYGVPLLAGTVGAVAKGVNMVRDSHYTADELAERQIKKIKAKAAKARPASAT